MVEVEVSFQLVIMQPENLEFAQPCRFPRHGADALVHQWVRPSTCKERGDCTRASRKVMQILQTVGGPFEKASIDEAYMDVTEAVEGNWDQAIKRCADLQQEIENRLGLTASFGIGQTRILAKMGSEVNKPNGIHRTLPDEIESFLALAV